MIRGSLNWTFLIVGTVIGAGYASGRELWQFFGSESGLAILLFTFIFSLSCYSIMMISYKKQSKHYATILPEIVGLKLKGFYDVFILFYLLATTIVMVAGSGAVGEIFNLSQWWGILLLLISILLVFSFKIEGFLVINKLLIPILILGLLSTLLLFIFDEKIPIFNPLEGQANWFAAFPFTSLNILPLIAVLGAIGDKIRTKEEIIISSICSGAILGGLTYLYNSSLIHLADRMNDYEIPLFNILENYSTSLLLVITLILWLAIFTTAASNMVGITTRLQRVLPFRFFTIVCLTLIVIVPISKVGFSTLIHYLYPAYGLLNLYVLSKLLIYPIIKSD